MRSRRRRSDRASVESRVAHGSRCCVQYRNAGPRLTFKGVHRDSNQTLDSGSFGASLITENNNALQESTDIPECTSWCGGGTNLGTSEPAAPAPASSRPSRACHLPPLLRQRPFALRSLPAGPARRRLRCTAWRHALAASAVDRYPPMAADRLVFDRAEQTRRPPGGTTCPQPRRSTSWPLRAPSFVAALIDIDTQAAVELRQRARGPHAARAVASAQSAVHHGVDRSLRIDRP